PHATVRTVHPGAARAARGAAPAADAGARAPRDREADPRAPRDREADPRARGARSAEATAAPSAPGEPPEAGPGRDAHEPQRSGDDLESLKSISETVRVDIRKLNELMNLVG